MLTISLIFYLQTGSSAHHNTGKSTQLGNQANQISAHSEPNWHKLGQICEFVQSVFSTFWLTFLKITLYAITTHFGSKSSTPVWEPVTHLSCWPSCRELWTLSPLCKVWCRCSTRPWTAYPRRLLRLGILWAEMRQVRNDDHTGRNKYNSYGAILVFIL